MPRTLTVWLLLQNIPSLYINIDASAAGYATPMLVSMLVTDNGSATIPWSFFSGLPPNGHIILWVARGNYTIATDGTYNYQVGGYSAAAIWDVVIPTAPATTTNPPTIKKPTPNNPAVDTIQSAL